MKLRQKKLAAELVEKINSPENKKFKTINQAITYINEGKFQEANATLEKENLTQSDLLKQIYKKSYTSNLIDFLEITPKNVHSIMENVASKEMSGAVEVLKSKKIDFLKIDKNGISLIQHILQISLENDENFIEVLIKLGADLVKEDFKKNSNPNFFIKMFSPYNNQDSDYYLQMLELKSPEVINSQGFKNIFQENNIVMNYIFNQDSHGTKLQKLKSLMDVSNYKEFASTMFMVFLTQGSQKINEKLYNDIVSLIDNNELCVNEKLLENKKIKVENIYHLDSKLIVKLLQKEIISLDDINKVIPGKITLFSDKLDVNLENWHRSRQDFKTTEDWLKKLPEYLNKLQSLIDAGIEPVVADYYNKGRENLNKKFNRILNYASDHRFTEYITEGFDSKDPELKKLCYDLHMPGFVVEKLVDFFDKRYNHPVNQERLQREKTLSQAQAIAQEQFNDFLEKVKFVSSNPKDNSIEENHKKITP